MTTATTGNEIYTLQEIETGLGFFTSGAWTMIYRVGHDRYTTCERSETPRNPEAEHVGGGRMTHDGKPRISWC